MKSSEEVPHDTDTGGLTRRPENATIPTASDVRAMMPQVSPLRYWIDRIDIPVQLGRIALFIGMWWLWWSDTIWNGWDSFSVFGITPFPNVPPTFRALCQAKPGTISSGS